MRVGQGNEIKGDSAVHAVIGSDSGLCVSNRMERAEPEPKYGLPQT